MKRVFIVIFLLIGLHAQATFEWNKNCQKAYTEIINLKFKHGKDLLKIEKQKIHRTSSLFIENYQPSKLVKNKEILIDLKKIRITD